MVAAELRRLSEHLQFAAAAQVREDGGDGILARTGQSEAAFFMSNPDVPVSEAGVENGESFDKILSQYEQSHSRKVGEDSRQIEGTVIAVSAESVFVDIGYKTEGILPLSIFQNANETVEVGNKLLVTVKGRDAEGYYELSRQRVERPKDWTAMEKAFAEKSIIVGTVTGVVKGGLSVDVGMRAFMPGSRSGARDAGELEKLVGQEITCRIIKLDIAEEDLVVDHRSVAEEEQRSTRERRFAEVKEGDTVVGTVRSLAAYGAFVDIGGVDGLLHISDIAWARVEKPEDVLSIGQQVEAKVLKVDADNKRISLGLKQLQPHPWDAVAEKYTVGERVRGVVTRVTDFGAFVELEPGVEGMVHLSEMSWAKKVHKPSDLLKPGETAEVMILGISAAERRMSLGLKQTLGDPWAEAQEKFAVGSTVEAPISSLTKFGAFVHLAEGVEGMIHVSEISAEKRVERPQDVLRVGEVVKAKVLDVDKDKRQIRLSMKQLVPTGLDEYIAEHQEGDVVTGRLIEVSGENATVELGAGIRSKGRVTTAAAKPEQPAAAAGQLDLSAFSSMLKERWKTGSSSSTAKADEVRAGQIRSFRITKLDRDAKVIEVQLV